MNDDPIILDQTDEEILTYAVADDVVERAAGPVSLSPSYFFVDRWHGTVGICC